MTRIQKILIVSILIATFALVYSPHLNYEFPLHIDEWHHISKTIKLTNGEYFVGNGAAANLEMGFHFILAPLAMVTDIVLIYQFLPALWAMLAGLMIFYVIRQQTGKFWLALLAMIFFASIKSNVNITGLWFFTPLTFSIPFIYLYIYLFVDGIYNHNKKNILLSLLIMCTLLLIHSISVLFSIPILIIYSLINFKYLKSEYKFFSIFLIVPVIGLLFYKLTMHTDWTDTLAHLITALQFKQGWGILEIRNIFTETYSTIGYILALFGAMSILSLKKDLRRKYSIFIIWPMISATLIIIYRITGVSYLTPYQRNLYYFTLSLPILSAFGLYYPLIVIKQQINQLRFSQTNRLHLKKIMTAIIIIPLFVLAFKSYYFIPKRIDIYHIIDNNNYQALLFLKSLPRAGIMADPLISSAIYPITNQYPVTVLIFEENKRRVMRFFYATNCDARQNAINGRNKALTEQGREAEHVKYIWLTVPIDCEWSVIYQENDNYIYQI